MSCDIWILCFYGGSVFYTNNDTTYNGESNKYLITTLDMFLTKLSKLLLYIMNDNYFLNVFIRCFTYYGRLRE